MVKYHYFLPFIRTSNYQEGKQTFVTVSNLKCVGAE